MEFVVGSIYGIIEYFKNISVIQYVFDCNIIIIYLYGYLLDRNREMNIIIFFRNYFISFSKNILLFYLDALNGFFLRSVVCVFYSQFIYLSFY